VDLAGKVANTHAHHDHIGANHQVKVACGALLAASRGEAGTYRIA